MNTIQKSLEEVAKNFEKTPTTYRFDIFKGRLDANNKVNKVRSIGTARLTEGNKTYVVYLKSLLKDVFYLLPEQKRTHECDFVILTREESRNPKKKFYWNNVGEGKIREGVMKLSFDLFGADDIYMSLYPYSADTASSYESQTNQLAEVA